MRFEENVQGQISEHIFMPNGGFCVYYPSYMFRNTRDLIKIYCSVRLSIYILIRNVILNALVSYIQLVVLFLLFHIHVTAFRCI